MRTRSTSLSIRVPQAETGLQAAAQPMVTPITVLPCHRNSYDGGDMEVDEMDGLTCGGIEQPFSQEEDELLWSIYTTEAMRPETTPIPATIPPPGLVTRVIHQAVQTCKREGGGPLFPHSSKATYQRILYLCREGKEERPRLEGALTFSMAGRALNSLTHPSLLTPPPMMCGTRSPFGEKFGQRFGGYFASS